MELIRQLKDALYDSEVFEHISTTVNKVKKVVRAAGSGGSASDTRSAIEEAESMLNTIKNKVEGREETHEGTGGDAVDEDLRRESMDSSADDHDRKARPAPARKGARKGRYHKCNILHMNTS